MTTTASSGAPLFPQAAATLAPSDQAAMDAAVAALQARKDAWVACPVPERIQIVDAIMRDFHALAPRWVEASVHGKGARLGSLAEGEEWASGPYTLLKELRQLRSSLDDIRRYGRPRIPGPVTERPDGQVVARVFPQHGYDRVLFTGLTAEVWMRPGVTRAGLPETMAVAYAEKNHPGRVALVLGAGNISSIGPLDALYKLLVEDQVVLYKPNPVNAYLAPLIEEALRALIAPGFLTVVHGGTAEGAYLCQHPGVDEIHMTGSDKTFDAIVFGSGPEGAARKAAGTPLLSKRITGELGSVSPVIVVPGPWSARDLVYQGVNIASMLPNNAGFNCQAMRVLVQHAGWAQRAALLGQVRQTLARVPSRVAYYPGARDRFAAFLAAHPEAERLSAAQGDELPWTLIANVPPGQAGDIAFTTEAFCSLFAETALEAASVPDYIERAVAFANERIYGTLSATLIVHPASLRDPATGEAVERAIAELRFGTVGVNYWGGAGFTLGVTPWGAFPGHPLHDIQSGTGVVHNTLMFDQPQKSVLRAPFRVTPTPPWFVTQGRAARAVFRKLAALEATPSPLKVPSIAVDALRG